MKRFPWQGVGGSWKYEECNADSSSCVSNGNNETVWGLCTCCRKPWLASFVSSLVKFKDGRLMERIGSGGEAFPWNRPFSDSRGRCTSPPGWERVAYYVGGGGGSWGERGSWCKLLGRLRMRGWTIRWSWHHSCWCTYKTKSRKNNVRPLYWLTLSVLFWVSVRARFLKKSKNTS